MDLIHWPGYPVLVAKKKKKKKKRKRNESLFALLPMDTVLYLGSQAYSNQLNLGRP